MIWRSLLVAGPLLLVACSSNPLGIADQEWLRMTPGQQHEARMEQARQNEAARARRAEQQRLERELEQQRLQERQQRVRQAAADKLLQCRLSRIQIDVGKNKWRNANPVAVELLQGESEDVWLVRSDKNHQRRLVRLGFEHLNVQLCDVGSRDCASLAATGRELQRGKQQAVSTGKVRAVLKCQYPPHFWRSQWQ